MQLELIGAILSLAIVFGGVFIRIERRLTRLEILMKRIERKYCFDPKGED